MPRTLFFFFFQNLGVVTYMHPNTRVDPGGLLASQPSLLQEFQASERPCLKKVKRVDCAGGKASKVVP